MDRQRGRSYTHSRSGGESVTSDSRLHKLRHRHTLLRKLGTVLGPLSPGRKRTEPRHLSPYTQHLLAANNQHHQQEPGGTKQPRDTQGKENRNRTVSCHCTGYSGIYSAQQKRATNPGPVRTSTACDTYPVQDRTAFKGFDKWNKFGHFKGSVFRQQDNYLNKASLDQIKDRYFRTATSGTSGNLKTINFAKQDIKHEELEQLRLKYFTQQKTATKDGKAIYHINSNKDKPTNDRTEKVITKKSSPNFKQPSQKTQSWKDSYIVRSESAPGSRSLPKQKQKLDILRSKYLHRESATQDISKIESQNPKGPPMLSAVSSSGGEKMDFSGFRSSGELSDTTVVVDGKEFKLHKFPLYIKSDFFRALARNPPKDVIELEDFPGGADVFEMVANFCYNVRIAITKDNVCALRCAAEFLQMSSRGNLADLADRFLQDTLTSAKLGRHLAAIIDLLAQSCSLGGIAEQAGIVDKCTDAIVDCWLLATKFTKRLPAEKMVASLTDTEVYERLSQFPLQWFSQLFIRARDKSVRPQVLGRLVQTYINSAVRDARGRDLMEETIQEALQAKQAREAPNKPAEDVIDEEHASEEEKSEKEEKDEEEESQDPAAKEESQDGEKEEEQQENEKDAEINDDSKEAENASDQQKEDQEDQENQEVEAPTESPREPVDMKEMLDLLVPEIPDSPVIADMMHPSWTIKVLAIAEELGCDCCPQLRAMVGRMLHRLTPQQLSDMPPPILTEIVQEACKVGEPGQHGLVCGVIDNYLRELSQKGELNVETFTTMVSAVPADYRMSHDTLFQVLESLLQSDSVKLTDEQKSALMDTIDFRRLSEATLQRAYDSDLVPQAYVTKAALALCSQLRGELESARAMIKSQEQELARYGLGGRTPPYARHYSRQADTVAPAHVVSPASKLRYEAPGITYTYPSGAISSLSSDLELQLALDSLDTTTDRSRLPGGDVYSSSPYTTSSYTSGYYDDPLDDQSYRSKQYYSRSYDRFNYRY